MNNIDVKKICAIIKTCGMCGVKHISLDGVSISFKDGTDVAYQLDDSRKTKVDSPEDVLNIEAAEIDRQVKTEAARDLEELAITDPEAFEREVLRGAIDAQADVGETE